MAKGQFYILVFLSIFSLAGWSESSIDNTILSSANFTGFGTIGLHTQRKHKQSGKLWMITSAEAEELTEFLAGGLYKLILGSRAPNIQLIYDDSNKKYYVGSEFVEGFTTLYEIYQQDFGIIPGNTDKFIKHNYPTVKNSLHFLNAESVLAACILLGEGDDHPANIGAVKEDNNGYTQYFSAKVDHDRSFTKLNIAPDNLYLLNNVRRFFFPIKNFDLEQLSLAFERIENIPDAEWDRVLNDRIQILKEIGLADDNAIIRTVDDQKNTLGDIFTKISARKKAVNLFVRNLRMEDAIMTENIDRIEENLTEPSAINGNYISIYISSEVANPVSLLELAVFHDKRKVLDWILHQSFSQESLHKGILRSIVMNRVDLYNLLIPHDKTKGHLEDYIETAIEKKSDKILALLLSGNSSPIKNERCMTLSMTSNNQNALKFFLDGSISDEVLYSKFKKVNKDGWISSLGEQLVEYFTAQNVIKKVYQDSMSAIALNKIEDRQFLIHFFKEHIAQFGKGSLSNLVLKLGIDEVMKALQDLIREGTPNPHSIAISLVAMEDHIEDSNRNKFRSLLEAFQESSNFEQELEWLGFEEVLVKFGLSNKESLKLKIAVSNNDMKEVTFLLHEGLKDTRGLALEEAVMKHNLEMLKLLIEHGARDPKGRALKRAQNEANKEWVWKRDLRMVDLLKTVQ